MTSYAKTDCVGASKGLFFGLLTLVCGLICLILFFVLIGHNNEQVSQLAIFLADLSHCAILIVSILATLLGFIRYGKFCSGIQIVTNVINDSLYKNLMNR